MALYFCLLVKGVVGLEVEELIEASGLSTLSGLLWGESAWYIERRYKFITRCEKLYTADPSLCVIPSDS